MFVFILISFPTAFVSCKTVFLTWSLKSNKSLLVYLSLLQFIHGNLSKLSHYFHHYPPASQQHGCYAYQLLVRVRSVLTIGGGYLWPSEYIWGFGKMSFTKIQIIGNQNCVHDKSLMWKRVSDNRQHYNINGFSESLKK